MTVCSFMVGDDDGKFDPALSSYGDFERAPGSGGSGRVVLLGKQTPARVDLSVAPCSNNIDVQTGNDNR